MKYYLLITITQLLWSGNTVVAHLANGHIGPFALAFFRWLLVGLILLPIVYKQFKQNKQLIIKYWRLITVLSILGIFLYTVLSYSALTYTTVIHSSIINATIPVFIVLFEFSTANISIPTIIGIISSFIGVIMIVSHGQPLMIFSMPFNFGDLLAIFSSIIWAIYSILLKKLPNKIPPLVFLMASSFISAPFLFITYLFEIGHSQSPIIIDVSTISFILYTAIGPAILAFTFWGIGVKHLGAVTAGYFINLLPVFSSILAVIFLHEQLQSYDIIGTICVLSGMYLSTKKSAIPVKNTIDFAT